MPAASLQCPLCAGVLQVDTSWGGGQVTCPHCQGLLTLPDEQALAELASGEIDAPPVEAPPLDAPPVEAMPPEAPPGINPPPLDVPRTFADLLPPSAPIASFAGQSEGPALPQPTSLPSAAPQITLPQPERAAAQLQEPAAKAETRRLTPEEKAQLRLRKNIILFVLCLGILLVVLYFLAR